MTDEAGADAKVIAVPHDKLSSMYNDVKECSDLPALLLAQIQHFFENYKALEPGKSGVSLGFMVHAKVHVFQRREEQACLQNQK